MVLGLVHVIDSDVERNPRSVNPEIECLPLLCSWMNRSLLALDLLRLLLLREVRLLDSLLWLEIVVVA